MAGGSLGGLEPRDPTECGRETHHVDSAHVEDLLERGREELGREEEEEK